MRHARIKQTSESAGSKPLQALGSGRALLPVTGDERAVRLVRSLRRRCGHRLAALGPALCVPDFRAGLPFRGERRCDPSVPTRLTPGGGTKTDAAVMSTAIYFAGTTNANGQLLNRQGVNGYDSYALAF